MIKSVVLESLVLLEIKGNTLVNRPRHLGTRKQASTNMAWMTPRVDFVVGFSLLLRAEFPLQVV